MAKDVEISLRIPNMKVRPKDEQGYPLDFSLIRFRKTLSVPGIPKPGEAIDLPTASGRVLRATVVRADWHEERGLFVVSCQYANRSIPQEEYDALAADPVWVMAPLI